MSTRSIIALPTDSGYITAWNWNDGGPENLGYELKNHFESEPQIRELIDHHSFSCVCDDACKTALITAWPSMVSEKDFIKLSNGRYIKKDRHHGKVVAGGENGFFESVDEMLEQDLNYVYVFEDGKWKTYK